MKKKGKKTKTERKIEKDLIKIVLFFVFLVILFLVASEIFRSLSQFEYEEMTFVKVKYGDLPLFKYSYYFEGPSGNLIRYVLLLKHDPRTNDVSIEGDEILFSEGKSIYLSIDTSEIEGCEESAVAIATLSAFLTDNQFNVIGATNDFIESNMYDYKYITCENRPQNVVINFNGAEETSISIDDKCHHIFVGPECNIVEAIEKYELQSILDSRE